MSAVPTTIEPDPFSTARHQRWVPVESLRVAPEYQRHLDESRVRRMARAFDPDAIGTIEVSQRDDGTMYVIDGQHRVALLRAVGWGDQLIPALVHVGLTLADEARIFYLTNTAVKPDAFARFNARLVAGDPAAKEVAVAVEAAGCHLARGPGPGAVMAVSAVVRVASNAGPEIVTRVLRILTDAWGDYYRDADAYPYHNEVIAGLGLLIARYPHLDDARMTDQLTGWSVRRLVGRARARREQMPGSSAWQHAAQALHAIYNDRLRSKSRRLEPWDVDRSDRAMWSPNA